MFRSTSLSHCTPTFVTPGLDPGVHRIMVSCEEMDCRVKPGKDDRKVACKRTEHAFKQKARRGFLRRCVPVTLSAARRPAGPGGSRAPCGLFRRAPAAVAAASVVRPRTLLDRSEDRHRPWRNRRAATPG